MALPLAQPPQEHNRFVRALLRGTDNSQATLYGAVQALGDTIGFDALEQLGADGVASNLREAMENPATVAVWDDVDSLSAFGSYILETVGEQMPQMLPQMGLLAISRNPSTLAMRGRLRQQMELDMTPQERAGIAKRFIRSTVGQEGFRKFQDAAPKIALGSMYAQLVGETNMALVEEGLEDNGALALALGLPKVMLDKIGIDRLLGAARITGQPVSTLANAARKVAEDASIAFGTEAVTETAQQFIDQVAVSALSEEKELFDKENLLNLREAFIKGGIAGGAFGGGISIYNAAANPQVGGVAAAQANEKLADAIDGYRKAAQEDAETAEADADQMVFDFADAVGEDLTDTSPAPEPEPAPAPAPERKPQAATSFKDAFTGAEDVEVTNTQLAEVTLERVAARGGKQIFPVQDYLAAIDTKRGEDDGLTERQRLEQRLADGDEELAAQLLDVASKNYGAIEKRLQQLGLDSRQSPQSIFGRDIADEDDLRQNEEMLGDELSTEQGQLFDDEETVSEIQQAEGGEYTTDADGQVTGERNLGLSVQDRAVQASPQFGADQVPQPRWGYRDELKVGELKLPTGEVAVQKGANIFLKRADAEAAIKMNEGEFPPDTELMVEQFKDSKNNIKFRILDRKKPYQYDEPTGKDAPRAYVDDDVYIDYSLDRAEKMARGKDGLAQKISKNEDNDYTPEEAAERSEAIEGTRLKLTRTTKNAKGEDVTEEMIVYGPELSRRGADMVALEQTTDGRTDVQTKRSDAGDRTKLDKLNRETRTAADVSLKNKTNVAGVEDVDGSTDFTKKMMGDLRAEETHGVLHGGKDEMTAFREKENAQEDIRREERKGETPQNLFMLDGFLRMAGELHQRGWKFEKSIEEAVVTAPNRLDRGAIPQSLAAAAGLPTAKPKPGSRKGKTTLSLEKRKLAVAEQKALTERNFEPLVDALKAGMRNRLTNIKRAKTDYARKRAEQALNSWVDEQRKYSVELIERVLKEHGSLLTKKADGTYEPNNWTVGQLIKLFQKKKMEDKNGVLINNPFHDYAESADKLLHEQWEQLWYQAGLGELGDWRPPGVKGKPTVYNKDADVQMEPKPARTKQRPDSGQPRNNVSPRTDAATKKRLSQELESQNRKHQTEERSPEIKPYIPEEKSNQAQARRTQKWRDGAKDRDNVSTVGDKTLPETMIEFIKDAQKELGLKGRVVLASVSDLAALGRSGAIPVAEAKALKEYFASGKKGVFIPNGDEAIIIVDDSLSESQMLHTLAHEYGHGVILSTYYKSDLPTRTMVERAWRNTRERDVQRKKHNPDYKSKYLGENSFQEWFADQIAAALLRTARGKKPSKPTSLKEKFFAKLANIIDRINDLLDVSTPVEQFIDRVRDRSLGVVGAGEVAFPFYDLENRHYFTDTVPEDLSPVAQAAKGLDNTFRAIARNTTGNSKIAALLRPVLTVHDELANMGPGMKKIADKFHRRSADRANINAVTYQVEYERVASAEISALLEILKGLPDDQVNSALNELRMRGTPTTEVGKKLRKFLDSYFDNVLAPHVKGIMFSQNDFPNVHDVMEVEGRAEEFLDTLVQHGFSQADAQEVWEGIVTDGGVFELHTYSRIGPSQRLRKLKRLNDSHLLRALVEKGFTNQHPLEDIRTYLHLGAQMATFSKMFGGYDPIKVTPRSGQTPAEAAEERVKVMLMDRYGHENITQALDAGVLREDAHGEWSIWQQDQQIQDEMRKLEENGLLLNDLIARVTGDQRGRRDPTYNTIEEAIKRGVVRKMDLRLETNSKKSRIEILNKTTKKWEQHDVEPFITKAERERVVKVVMGALGKTQADLPRGVLRTMSNATAVVHAMVLGLAQIGQLVEIPVALVALKGDVRTWAKAYVAAIGNRKELLEAYKALGTVDSSALADMIANIHGYQNKSKFAQNLNSWVFRLNGLDWTVRTMQLAATHGFINKIQKWAKEVDDSSLPDRIRNRSKGYLKENGLTAEEVHAWVAYGKPLSGRKQDFTEGSLEQRVAIKVARGIAQFRVHATVRPNRFQRPNFMNDPDLMLLASLKPFMFGFHENAYGAVLREAENRYADKDMPGLAGIGLAIFPAFIVMALMANELREEIKYAFGDMPEPNDSKDAAKYTGDLVFQTLAAGGQVDPYVRMVDHYGGVVGGLASYTPVSSKAYQFVTANGLLNKLMTVTPGLAQLPGTRDAIRDWVKELEEADRELKDYG